MSNRLAFEQSPYLLQHKENPVDWYPWGDAAFQRARGEDKPIFLSVGYSTCHWCHVMEHESFESPDIAAVLNRDFVSIKVDREERPDVDRVYMTFVQATTGSGGWPMSVWLTPALEPFYGGTYYPPTSRWGRPGFVEVLTEIARAWRDERQKVVESASAIVGRLRSYGSRTGSPHEVPGDDVLEDAVRQFGGAFDTRRGGFGSAPKFPRPSELLFLLREYARIGSEGAREMSVATLRAMALGGMRDHIGGGFHRYSVDADWRVPHFEKMLYDQAQLTLAYLEAGQATGDAFFFDVARDTLAYVLRDLRDRDGAFWSAEDADSVPPEAASGAAAHPSEGAFYIWRDDEIGEVLGDDADVFRLRFGVLSDGNAPFDPQQEFTGKNLLYVARSVEDVSTAVRRPASAVEAALTRARSALMEARAVRIRPHLDDKVLTAWNGLMIAALARAGRTLPKGESFTHDAIGAARFVRDRLWSAESGSLLRRYRHGASAIEGYAEDYAYLTAGVLEVFQATGDPGWLQFAVDLQHAMDERFWDPDGGGWFSTSGRDASVLLRLKEEYDGAEPSASSVGVLNLLSLHYLTSDDSFRLRAEHTLRSFLGRGGELGRSMPMMMAALSAYHAGMPTVVVVGHPGAPDTEALMSIVRAQYCPNALVVPVDPDRQDVTARAMPWTADMRAQQGHAAAYVCEGWRCQLPTTDPEVLHAQLRTIGMGGR